MNREVIAVCKYLSPCGELAVGTYNGSLVLCDWYDEIRWKSAVSRLKRYFGATVVWREDDDTAEACRLLDLYFAGNMCVPEMPMRFAGTPFQCKVWRELCNICYGTTMSYSDIAAKVGNKSAVRAVAGAIGGNLISIFVPCHRVIGRDGSLTGYAGGIEAKKFLLEFEAQNTLRPLP